MFTQLGGTSSVISFVNGKCMVNVNGKSFIEVVSVTINTLTEEWKSENFGSLSITLEGDVDQITTTAGSVRVTGDVKHTVKTMSGDLLVSGNCGGSASSMSGDVTIIGNLTGKASSMSGNVTVNRNK